MTDDFLHFALPLVRRVESCDCPLEEGSVRWVSEAQLRENYCFHLNLKLCRLSSFRSVPWGALLDHLATTSQPPTTPSTSSESPTAASSMLQPICISVNASVNYLRDLQDLAPGIVESLRALDLSINRLCSIGVDSSLDKCTHLVVLDLSNNGLTQIQGLRQLKRLKSLRLEQNRIEKIEGLEGLRRLVHLSLRLNRIDVVENLQNLQCLEILDISNNELKDALHLCFVPSLRKVNLSNNGLADLEEMRDLVLSLDQLVELQTFGNPVEKEELYKVYLLIDAPKIERFDMMPVDSFLRSQLEQFKRQKNMDDVVESTSNAYMSIIESEKRNQNSVIARLNSTKKSLIDSMTTYSDQMEQELEECLAFIQTLANDPERLKRSILASDQGVLKFREIIAAKERERQSLLNKRQDERERQEMAAVTANVHGTSYEDKLLALSKYKPELWRELKRLELHTSLTEERSEEQHAAALERRRTEARQRLTQRFISRETSFHAPFAKIEHGIYKSVSGARGTTQRNVSEAQSEQEVLDDDSLLDAEEGAEDLDLSGDDEEMHKSGSDGEGGEEEETKQEGDKARPRKPLRQRLFTFRKGTRQDT